jgi:polar amino acid transport system substrate-binding protein
MIDRAKVVGAACCVALAVLALGVCGVSSATTSRPTASAGSPLNGMLPASIRKSGKIVVAIEAAFPPMEYKAPATNTYDGFDVNFADALGKALGVKIVFQDQSFDQLLISLQTHRANMVISAISDTRTREKRFNFIDYFDSGALAYTSTAQSASVHRLSALCGKTVAVPLGTDFLETFQSWSKAHCPSGKPITVSTLGSEELCQLQVTQGRDAAAVEGPDEFGWLQKQQPGKFVGIPPVLNPEPYGIVFNKTDGQLQRAVLAAARELFSDGTYKSLLKKWDVSDDAVPKPTVNAAPAGT